MLIVLQYLALLAAFFLPWTIGGAAKLHKDGNTRGRNLCVLSAVICAILIESVAVLAFSITPV